MMGTGGTQSKGENLAAGDCPLATGLFIPNATDRYLKCVRVGQEIVLVSDVSCKDFLTDKNSLQ